MKNLLLSLITLLLTTQAHAAEVVFGLSRQTVSENEMTGKKVSSRPGFGFGVRTEYNFNENWAMTAGMLLEQRSTTDVINGVEHNPMVQYLDFPFQFKYNFTDAAYGVAGANFWTLLNEKCGPTSGDCLILEGPVKFVAPVHVGAGYNFSESFGAEVFYEYLNYEFWKNAFKNLSSTGINLKYLF